MKNIANMHREHDVSFFQTSSKTSRSMFFLKNHLKIASLGNWETSHREKHRIVKKSEHRPPLSAPSYLINDVILSTITIIVVILSYPINDNNHCCCLNDCYHHLGCRKSLSPSCKEGPLGKFGSENYCLLEK